jgi:cation:H+ antiporter
VAVTAGLKGTPQIAMGDALGSNIVNVALILGIVLCIGPIAVNWRESRREFYFALGTPFLIVFILLDGVFARWEAILCLGVFLGWLGLVLREALQNRRGTESSCTRREAILAILCSIAGMGCLVLAGQLIVEGASGVGRAFNMDPFLIGATMVAFGTSAPELATAVISKIRGHDEVGLGTILGSNIFNCLFIVGLTSTISPFAEPLEHVIASILFGLLAVLCLAPLGAKKLGRARGVVLLIVYVLSIAAAWALSKDLPAH